MPHVSRQFIHTLEDVPRETTGATYVNVSFKNGSACPVNFYQNATTLRVNCHRDISAAFYKDLKVCLTQLAEDDPAKFPYELEFAEDEDVVYTNGQMIPPFKLGTNSYGISVGNLSTVTSPSVPWPCVYYGGGSSNTAGTTPSLILGGTSYWSDATLFNNYYANSSLYSLYNIDQKKWVYTIHVYYNTDFLVVAFTTPKCGIPFSLFQQIKAKDRFNKDWYFIARFFGLEYMKQITLGGPVIIRPADDADGNCDWTKGECIAQHYGKTYDAYDLSTPADYGFWFASSYSRDTNQFPHYYSPIYDFSSAASSFPIVNPCFNSTANAGKWPNLGVLMTPLRNDSSLVCIANPILFNGLFTMSNQILCASINIENNQEYIFNDKRYYVFGERYMQKVPFPILFELEDVDPEEDQV